MSDSRRFLRWTPARVSWVSFVIMGLVVAGVGLTGTAHVVDYLHGRLKAHGIDHNREVARRLRPLLADALRDRDALQQAIATFGVFGYRLFVIDRTQGRLVADSRGGGRLPRPLRASWLAGASPPGGTGPVGELRQGAMTAVGEEGHPLLLWLEEITPGGPWLLGVGSDESSLSQFLEDLHWHLDGVMLLTYLSIALLGYFAMRGIGRVYERDLEAQIRERTQALEKAYSEILAKTRLATIGQTASVLAHEMRNPLASIKLALAGLRGAESLSERERRRVGLVLGEVDRLDALLSETLDYVRPVKISTRPVRLDRLLRQVLDQQRPLLEEHRLRVRHDLPEECVAVHLDQDKMHQVLLNLVKNAIEASPPGGEIGVRLSCDHSEVALEIDNRGEPMAAETLKRAFEPFYTTKPRGSGLGLGLVKRVVEEHGGRVELASDLRDGTRVTLRLPTEGLTKRGKIPREAHPSIPGPDRAGPE